MKKTLLSLAFVAMGIAAFAQKPAAGDKTAEFNLNFQTGTAPVNYGLGATTAAGIPELRLRYFMSDDMAIRVKLGLGSSSTTTKQTASIGGSDVTGEFKTNTGFGVAITPGIEKHFAGTTKLSPFVGAELPIGFGTGATLDASNSTDGSTVTGSGDHFKSEAGSVFGIGLRLVLGADYYIADGVYLGVEGGLGIFNMTSHGDAKVTVTPGGGTATTTTSPGASSFDLFNATSGAVRLGYKF